MAGAGTKLFVDGQILTAAQVNTYLQDQVIMRFANAASRDAAFGGVGEPVLAEGMFCYLDDTNTLQSYNGSAWVNVLSSSTPPGMELVYSNTFTSTAAVTASNVFSNTYTNYCLVYNGYSIDLALRYLRVQLVDNTGAQNAGYTAASVTWGVAAGVTPNAVSNTTNAYDLGPIGPDSNNPMIARIDIGNPFQAFPTSITGTSFGHAYGSYYAMNIVGGVQTSFTSYHGLKLFASAGNFKGNICIYGYRI